MSAAINLKSIDVNEQLLHEVVQCVQSIFKDGFNIDVVLKDSQIGIDQIAVADVSGIVGMVQEQFEGNLILSFTQTVIFDILQRVYSKKFDSVDDIVKQGTAELANMIYGQIKRKLNERGHDLKMALPNVVIGAGHNIHCSDSCTSLLAVFNYDDDKEFKLFIALQGG